MKTTSPLQNLSSQTLNSLAVPVMVRRVSGRGFVLKGWLVVAALFATTVFSSFASDPIGIYAFVDKVVFEPDEKNPERIQVWGGFALAEGREAAYTSAQRGYMYFKLAPGKETVSRNEWSDLKAVAGSGTLVAFGRRHTNNGTVHKPDTKVENADVYPIGFGMQKLTARDYKPLKELKALQSDKKAR